MSLTPLLLNAAPEIQVDNAPGAPNDRYGVVSRASEGLTGASVASANIGHQESMHLLDEGRGECSIWRLIEPVLQGVNVIGNLSDIRPSLFGVFGRFEEQQLTQVCQCAFNPA